MNSIGDFAEKLIQGEVEDVQQGKALPPSRDRNAPQAAPAGRDIRGTQIPNTMMEEILGEAFHPQTSPPAEAIPEIVWTDPEEKEEIKEPSLIAEEKVDELLGLLREVKELLSEMTMATTTTGQIGMNLAGPSGEVKIPSARGYRSSTKATLPSNFKNSRDVFKQAMARRSRK